MVEVRELRLVEEDAEVVEVASELGSCVKPESLQLLRRLLQ